MFVFCGTEMYGGFPRFVNSPSTDGTVRIAGCALNTRKFDIDLSRAAERCSSGGDQRSTISQNKSIDFPVWPIKGKTHGTILSDPPPISQELVLGALQVDSRESYEAWRTKAKAATNKTREQLPQWQQFVVHAVYERGDPISDYQIELYSMEDDTQLDLQLDPDIYRYDSGYRSYHVDVRDLVGMTGKLYVKVIAKSGSGLVEYYGIGSEKFGADGLWDAIVPITASQNFFPPFTTTLIELRLNRDPKPFTADRVKLCYFGEWGKDD